MHKIRVQIYMMCYTGLHTLELLMAVVVFNLDQEITELPSQSMMTIYREVLQELILIRFLREKDRELLTRKMSMLIVGRTI